MMRNICKDENGAALITSILALLLVTLLGFAMIASGFTAINISNNDIQQTEAFYISEAGLTHAKNLVMTAGASNFNNILQAGDGVAGTGDELSTQPAGLTPIPQAGLAFGRGSYKVKVTDDIADTDGNPNADSNGRILITSTATGRDGSSATIEVLVAVDNTSRIGILADGDIINSNNVFVRGVGGTIHANGSLDTSSNICIDNFVAHSSGNAMNLSKIASDATCSTPATVDINVFYTNPKITPEIYDVSKLQSTLRPQADYIFKADGGIYLNGSSVSMTSAEITAAGLDGWTWNSSAMVWSYSSATVIPNGTYYVEGSGIKITNGGDDVTPPQITLISEGSIEITNAPSFQPKLSGFALVAANDIKISSKIGVSGNPGLVYSYGHMEITNQSTIYGWIQAANFRQSDGTNGPDAPDPGGNNLVAVSSKGTLRISNVLTVNAPSGLGAGNSLKTQSWREVRY